MVKFPQSIHRPIQLVCYPPYHSNRVAGRDNPIERVWAALENYWKGLILECSQYFEDGWFYVG